jgi:tRNA threonylcarbamoyladenosine biosynthesis protein TsaB
MYLGIRTDSPIAELYIYDDTTPRAEKTWQADRQLAHGLLTQLETFLQENNATFQDLTGLFVYQGPGSFTGLRIGLTVMNTIAYAQKIAIVGSEGDMWREDAVTRLASGESDEIVLPRYGAEPRITKPTK